MTTPAQGEPLTASRVRKARALSVCGLREVLIKVGNPIGRVSGRGWCHAACIVAANREAAITEGDRA